jgi:hypothetical protein
MSICQCVVVRERRLPCYHDQMTASIDVAGQVKIVGDGDLLAASLA